MLLLLLPSESGMRRVIKLGSLFEITMGIMDDGTKYFYTNADKKNPIRMLRMGMFDPTTGTMLGIDDIHANERKVKSLRKLGKERISKTREVKRTEKELNQNRVLTPNDYLISLRINRNQTISGYSLLDSPLELMSDELGPCIASHHFLCLRPRTDIGEFYIPFMHLMIDLIIKHDLALRVQKGEKNILTVKWLNNLSINYLFQKTDQEEEYARYKSKKIERAALEIELLNIEGEILTGFKK